MEILWLKKLKSLLNHQLFIIFFGIAFIVCSYFVGVNYFHEDREDVVIDLILLSCLIFSPFFDSDISWIDFLCLFLASIFVIWHKQFCLRYLKMNDFESSIIIYPFLVFVVGLYIWAIYFGNWFKKRFLGWKIFLFFLIFSTALYYFMLTIQILPIFLPLVQLRWWFLDYSTVLIFLALAVWPSITIMRKLDH